MSNQPSRREFIKGTAAAALTAGLPSVAHADKPAVLPFEEYAKYDGLGLAELVKNREVKPAELLEAAIARAEAINPKINAIVVKLYEQARQTIANGLPDGPFKGVPFLVKDLGFWMKGVECTEGSRLYRGNIPTEDDVVVTRLRHAGLVLFARTHVPELGTTATSESALHGQTRNPWQLDRIAGGSSGGTAAAIAAGIAPIGSGSDGGGSIRIPASCCGLFGMKPTRGRVPLGPRFFEKISGLAVLGGISRTVRDSAALLDAIGGPDLGDPYGHPRKRRPFLDEVTREPERLRIGVIDSTYGKGEMHPECATALDHAASLCRTLGHAVHGATEDFAQVIPAEPLGFLWDLNARAAVDRRLRELGRELEKDEVEPITKFAIDRAKEPTALELMRARSVLHRTSKRMAELQKNFDLLLLPTLAKPPIQHGVINLSRSNPAEMIKDLIEFNPFCVLANQTGQPAMSVPLHWTSDGLPVGVQFFGRFGDEATLFQLAGQLEQAQPWKDKRPPI